jgi:hypothetical protein
MFSVAPPRDAFTDRERSYRCGEEFEYDKGVAGEKVEAIECYFGGRQGYPCAASLNVPAGNRS